QLAGTPGSPARRRSNWHDHAGAAQRVRNEVRDSCYDNRTSGPPGPHPNRLDCRCWRRPSSFHHCVSRLMSIQLHEEVILARDVPQHGLRLGDVGTVVHVYPKGGLEVEFFTAAGKTRAVVTLRGADVRAATDNDVVAVRTLDPTG